MNWLEAVVVRVAHMGPWGVVLFTVAYVAAAVTLAPAFVLTIAAGAIFGLWRAVVGDALWVMFLLRLSPLVPYVLLNYALALSGVRFKDFVLATVGMLPAIVMYAYYGKIVGDVAKLAAGVSPPRGIEYWTLVGLGLVATILATSAITRAARRAMEEQRIAETLNAPMPE